MSYLKTCTSQSKQNALLNIRAIPLLTGVYFTATLMALSTNFAIFARVVKMLNFHNVYDFFNDSQKSIQKKEKKCAILVQHFLSSSFMDGQVIPLPFPRLS